MFTYDSTAFNKNNENVRINRLISFGSGKGCKIECTHSEFLRPCIAYMMGDYTRKGGFTPYVAIAPYLKAVGGFMSSMSLRLKWQLDPCIYITRNTGDMMFRPADEEVSCGSLAMSHLCVPFQMITPHNIINTCRNCTKDSHNVLRVWLCWLALAVYFYGTKEAKHMFDEECRFNTFLSPDVVNDILNTVLYPKSTPDYSIEYEPKPLPKFEAKVEPEQIKQVKPLDVDDKSKVIQMLLDMNQQMLTILKEITAC